MKKREPWGFCKTPEENCTMNYCDEYGCQNRKINYVNGKPSDGAINATTPKNK